MALDRGAREPLSDQLAAAIEARIATGAARVRATVCRRHASSPPRSQINRGTIQAAYRRLARARARRGARRQRHGRRRARRRRRLPTSRSISTRFSHAGRGRHRPSPPPPRRLPLVADFSRLTPDERFFPIEEFTMTLTAAWSRRRDLWQYAPPLGLLGAARRDLAAPRRVRDRTLARRDPRHERRPAGSRSALPDVHRSRRRDRRRVADLLRRARARAVRGRRDDPASDGRPTGPTPTPLLGRRAKLVYVMPERQNPTGVTDGRRAPRRDPRGGGGRGRARHRGRLRGARVRARHRSPSRAARPRRLARHAVEGPRSGAAASAGSPGHRAIIERLARVKKTADFQTPLPDPGGGRGFPAGRARTARPANAARSKSRRAGSPPRGP